MSKLPIGHRPRTTHPFLIIGIMIVIVFLTSEAFFLAVNNRQSSLTHSPSVDLTAVWQPYINITEGYSFEHPAMINGPTTIRDDLVEIYEEVEGLVLMISSIDLPLDPAAWLATQTIETFSKKPWSCFHQTTVTSIPSATDAATMLLRFDRPVLFLDNIKSPEAKQGSCSGIPNVRLILTRHNDKILRITFSGTPLSEQMLSTFRFVD